MDTRSKLPPLMCDGAASVRALSEAKCGADPDYPASAPPQLPYAPNVIEPSNPSFSYYAGVLWTRMGLAGRDFGGPDVFP